MRLDEMKPGNGGVIRNVGGSGPLRRRILDMGLTPNTKIYVRKVAPMGDPIEITVRGYELTIRGDDASIIEVSLSENNNHHMSTIAGQYRHKRGHKGHQKNNI